MKKIIFLTFKASASYFVIYIMLKFSLQNAIIDWQNAFLGAITFGFLIFLIHKFFIWTEPVI